MHKEPLISVIMPAYNVEKYIESAIRSVWSQIIEDWELIIINDGSTDTTLDVIKKWNVDDRIRVISIENKGVSAARNIGLRESRGKYVCFVDSDDMLDVCYLEHMVMALQEHSECRVAVCKRKNIAEQDYTIQANNQIEFQVEKRESIVVLRDMLYRNISIGIWNLLIERKIFEEFYLEFAEGYSYSEDLELVWKIICNCSEVVILQEQLYLYRQRSTSAMQQFSVKRYDGYQLFLRLEEYISSNRADFTSEFNSYGVAYWVWSTVWQAARLSPKYKVFMNNVSSVDVCYYFERLKRFPKMSVRISAKVFLFCSRLYFFGIKLLVLVKK